MKDEFSVSWIVLLLRVVLGMVLITAGFSMIFLATPGTGGGSATFSSETFEGWPPDSQLWVLSWVGEDGNPTVLTLFRILGMAVPWVLLVAGAMILVGFLTRWAGIALGVTFLVLMAAMLIKDPLSSFTGHIMSYFLMVLLILLFERLGNIFSADALFFHGREREILSGGSWTALFARLAIGLFFLAGAYLKLGTIGLDSYIKETFVQGYSQTWLPGFLLPIAGYFDVFAELIGGVLLIFGLLTPLVAAILCLFMLMLILGHLIASPFYGFTGLILPYFSLLLLIFYLAMKGANRISLDNLLFGRKRD
jgi:putative oxidoreductase